MAAALADDLLADTRQRDQRRLIFIVLLFSRPTGRTRVFWNSAREHDQRHLTEDMFGSGPPGPEDVQLVDDFVTRLASPQRRGFP